MSPKAGGTIWFPTGFFLFLRAWQGVIAQESGGGNCRVFSVLSLQPLEPRPVSGPLCKLPVFIGSD